MHKNELTKSWTNYRRRTQKKNWKKKWQEEEIGKNEIGSVLQLPLNKNQDVNAAINFQLFIPPPLQWTFLLKKIVIANPESATLKLPSIFKEKYD